MTSGRKPYHIAKRALILGAIAFRSSLEVTNHPRVVGISLRLLPWLIEMGCDDEIDPIERELLATPLGQLSDSQRVDANGAGGAAAFFCWTLKLGELLEEVSASNQSDLPSVLRILRPEATEILRSPSLRVRREIEETCQHIVLIRSMLQESQVGPPACDTIRRMNLQKLKEVGLVIADDAVPRASEAVSRMATQERSQVAGLYFVRHHAALWFLSDRSRYFG